MVPMMVALRMFGREDSFVQNCWSASAKSISGLCFEREIARLSDSFAATVSRSS